YPPEITPHDKGKIGKEATNIPDLVRNSEREIPSIGFSGRGSESSSTRSAKFSRLRGVKSLATQIPPRRMSSSNKITIKINLLVAVMKKATKMMDLYARGRLNFAEMYSPSNNAME